MELAYTLSGAFPLIKKYQVNESVTRAGIPLLAPGAGNAGVALGTTTSAADMVGVALDTATYVTAQQTDGTSAERKVSLIINPDAVWKALMSGGATNGTALALQTITTATTDGLDVTTAAEWSNPTFDEGVVWGYAGVNAGQIRKITSVSSTAGTPTVAFDYDHQVGDTFLRAPYWPMQTVTVQLTTTLDQANAIIAVGTGAAYRVVDLELYDQGGEGRTKSCVLFVANDHVLNVTT